MFPDLEFIKTCLNGLRSRIEKVESWAVFEDQVTQTVADYFVKNPIVESDPTVPAWAKEPTKPTYTAKEIGAQPDMYVGNFDSVLRELAGKTVVYVSYPGSASPIPSGRYPVLLMRSGIDRGQASIVAYDAAGKTWAGGANFVQGTIELVERTLTASDIGAIPAPATASVGQAIVVKAVDENGKPTEWEAADMGSGVGGGTVEDLPVLQSFTIEDDETNIIEFTNLQNLTEFEVEISWTWSSTTGVSGIALWLKAGFGVWRDQTPILNNGMNRNITAKIVFKGKRLSNTVNNIAIIGGVTGSYSSSCVTRISESETVDYIGLKLTTSDVFFVNGTTVILRGR